MMDLSRSGGPAYPTLSGGQLREGFRWEGACLFDIYFTAALKSGKSAKDSFEIAKESLELRNSYIISQDNVEQTNGDISA
jgi:hypothetical protein